MAQPDVLAIGDSRSPRGYLPKISQLAALLFSFHRALNVRGYIAGAVFCPIGILPSWLFFWRLCSWS